MTDNQNATNEENANNRDDDKDKIEASKRAQQSKGWKRATPTADAIAKVYNSLNQEAKAVYDHLKSITESIGLPAHEVLLAKKTMDDILKNRSIGGNEVFVKSIGAEQVAKGMIGEQIKKEGVITALVMAHLQEQIQFANSVTNRKTAEAALDRVKQNPKLVEDYAKQAHVGYDVPYITIQLYNDTKRETPTYNMSGHKQR